MEGFATFLDQTRIKPIVMDQYPKIKIDVKTCQNHKFLMKRLLIGTEQGIANNFIFSKIIKYWKFLLKSIKHINIYDEV